MFLKLINVDWLIHKPFKLQEKKIDTELRNRLSAERYSLLGYANLYVCVKHVHRFSIMCS